MAIPGDKVLEANFRTWLDQQFTKRDWFFQSIETTTQSGVPDAYAIPQKAQPFWYELKTGCLPNPLIRKEQRVWAFHHHKKGGRSLLLYLRYDLNEVWIYQPPYVNVVKSGRWLALLDTPILKLPKQNLIDSL